MSQFFGQVMLAANYSSNQTSKQRFGSVESSASFQPQQTMHKVQKVDQMYLMKLLAIDSPSILVVDIFEVAYPRPQTWLFTSKDGTVGSVSLQEKYTFQDLLLSIVRNRDPEEQASLRPNEIQHFTNDDFIRALEQEKLAQDTSLGVCFGLFRTNGKDKRVFMNLQQLNLIAKKKNKANLLGLQLLHVPTRPFQPFFYYHDVEYKGFYQGQRMYKHRYSWISHETFYKLQHKLNVNLADFETKLADTALQNSLKQQTLNVISHLESKLAKESQEGVKFRSLRCVYMVEEASETEVWLAGLERGQVMALHQIKLPTSTCLSTLDPPGRGPAAHKLHVGMLNRPSGEPTPRDRIVFHAGPEQTMKLNPTGKKPDPQEPQQRRVTFMKMNKEVLNGLKTVARRYGGEKVTLSLGNYRGGAKSLFLKKQGSNQAFVNHSLLQPVLVDRAQNSAVFNGIVRELNPRPTSSSTREPQFNYGQFTRTKQSFLQRFNRSAGESQPEQPSQFNPKVGEKGGAFRVTVRTTQQGSPGKPSAHKLKAVFSQAETPGYSITNEHPRDGDGEPLTLKATLSLGNFGIKKYSKPSRATHLDDFVNAYGQSTVSMKAQQPGPRVQSAQSLQLPTNSRSVSHLETAPAEVVASSRRGRSSREVSPISAAKMLDESLKLAYSQKRVKGLVVFKSNAQVANKSQYSANLMK